MKKDYLKTLVLMSGLSLAILLSACGKKPAKPESTAAEIEEKETTNENESKTESILDKLGEFKWPTGKLGKIVPAPKADKGNIELDISNFIVVFAHLSGETFEEYAERCIASGFDVDYHLDYCYFNSENKDEVELIMYYDSEINVVEIQADLPIGYDEDESEETTEAPTTTAPTTTEAPTESSSTIRSDVKEAAESYEKFVDEYCAFMKDYSATDFSKLSKYMELINTELEMTKKFEALQERQDLNPAEAIYVAEVANRCAMKMLNTIN